MPLVKLSFRPGINKESTSYSNEGGYYDSNLVRFRSGYPETIGGWQNITADTTNTFKGVARSLWPWITHDNSKYMAIGTTQKFYVETGSKYYDVTPIRPYSSTTDEFTLGATPISTTNGSRIVTISHTGHGATAGTYVRLTSTSTVGGLDINGDYEIVTKSTNDYTIDGGAAASSTTTGGGTVKATYDINIGSALYVGPSVEGWGTGPWSNGTWGNSGTGTAPTVLYTFTQLWSQCRYGEDLVMAPRGGTLYYWDYSTATTSTPYDRAEVLSTRANGLAKLSYTSGSGFTFSGSATTITVDSPLGITAGCVVTGTNIPAGTYVTTAYDGGTTVPISGTTTGASSGTYTFSYSGRFVPERTEFILAADAYAFVICLGANPYDPTTFSSTYDPMLVRWCDQDNVYEWTPAITNQAGEQKLNVGSYLVCGRVARQEILIWSDAALYSMQYLGPAGNVFGFTLLSDNLSIASQNAVASANNQIFWMGVDKFYTYTGRVDTIPCTLQNYVFGDINKDCFNQVVSGSNEGFNEVWWFYPSASSTINDRYVIYNYVENLWYHGELSRTAWFDSPLYNKPRAAFSTQETYLTAAITSAATEIEVMSAGSLPNSGTVRIGSEEINYSAKTGNRLQNCTRGVNNTTAASAIAYTPVTYKVSNQVVEHETGTDDGSLGVPAPINAYVASSDFDIGDGHQFGFVWRILPDLTFEGSTTSLPQVNLLLKARSNSGTDYISSGNPTVQRLSNDDPEQYTGYPVTPLNHGQVYTRVRGRQMRFVVESNQTGVKWKLGQMRVDIRPDGRRA